MNPFTKFLRRGRNQPDFDLFVDYWDRLEALTIRIYKEQVDEATADSQFNTVWPWLREAYGRFQPILGPYWRQTRAAGALTTSDPFLLLLDLQAPADIRDNWRAMQHLPAAREAINLYLSSE